MCRLVNTPVSGYSVCLCFRQASELAIQQFLIFLLAGLKLWIMNIKAAETEEQVQSHCNPELVYWNFAPFSLF